MTRKLVFGVLMTLVLAFSMQGVADALTLTRVSDQYQSKRLGSSFEIKFSVGLTSPTIAYNTARKRISDHNTATEQVRIDSQGYQVTDVEGREYRNTAETSTADRFVGPLPAYSTDSQGNTLPASQQSVAATAPFYVDTGRNLINSDGRPVYDRTGGGTRAATGVAADPWRYTRAKADPEAAIAEADRFDFNEESISVAVTTGTVANVTITDMRDGQSAATMAETNHFAQLRSSVTLDCAVSAAGTYVITITDTTADEDFPALRVPGTKQSITFTLYVTEQSSTLVSGTNTITATATRVDTGLEKEPVSSRFTVAPDPGDVQVRYRVVEGNGTLYVGNEELTQGSPTSDLTVHQSTEVWINTNRTTNKVTATLQGGDPNVNSFQASIVFEYTGTDRRTPSTTPTQPTQPTQPIQPTAPVTVSVPSPVSGTAGGTATLRVTAAATATVTIGGLGDTFPRANASSLTRSGTTFTSTLTLPDQVGAYSLTVFVGNTRYPVTVNVTAAPVQTGTLTVRVDPFNGAPGTTATVTVTAADSSAQPANVTVTLSAVGGTLASSSVSTGTDGTATVSLTRGSTPGSGNYVTASANNYDSVQGRFLITGSTPPTTTTPTTPTTPTTRAPAGEPAYIDIYDGDGQSGPLNVQLQDALVVEVLDANENPVENVRVGFSVTQGSGRLSPRSVRTDDSGFAEVNFTPTSAGEVIVRARIAGVDEVEFTVTAGDPPASLTLVSGDNQPGNPGSRLANALVVEVRDEDGDPIEGIRVTFAVTAGGGRLSETSVVTNAQGRAQTSLTLGSERAVNSVQASVADLDPVTFNTSIDPVIRVAAANRPVMYWIDGGALYRLAGAKAEQIAPSANDVAVDAAGGKVYYIEGTSATTGRVHSVNLDGTGATVVKELTSVPMGLAHDSTSGKLYLTNSWGKIQRMNVDGTAFETNFIVGLTALRHIAVGGGKVYWTDGAGNVRYANVAGDKSPHNIATGSGALGGIAASGNTVYWTEQTSSTTGRIRSANFNGAPAVAADLFTLTAVPAGIAVDGNTLYWANGWGKVQRRNIDRSKFQDVVTGLMAPGAVAVGGVNVATPQQQPTPQQPTTVKSKYDVNNDGTVDTTDVGIVVAAVLSGSNQASLDVNGDGKVDLTDVVAVSQNVDNSGAAGAPAALRTRLSAVQVDRIQEQIDLLLGMNDRSPGALYTLAYLQNLLAMARPEKTQLLANYPNPFNPETWIPYELATDTNVKLTIYNAQGVVVRTLELGHQTAGYYTGRDRAAYWDGRNSFGELVASGLYFYQLETDKTSSMRKMVILK